MSEDMSRYLPSSMRSAHIRNLKFWENSPSFKAGSVVCITGAGSGIAREISYVYASRGAKLVLCDLNTVGLEETLIQCRKIAKELYNIPEKKEFTLLSPNSSVLDLKPSDESNVQVQHSTMIGIKCNVTVEKECNNFVELAIQRFGQIDHLLLCAGIGAHNVFADTKDMGIFKKCIDVNYYGYLFCTFAAFPYLIKSKGVLTAITSFSGEVGLPYRTAYCGSKFAVTGFLESLRAELGALNGDKFDIVIVCPPSVSTNLRQNSLTTDASLKNAGQDDSKSMSVKDCAACIVDATDRRLRKAFFPWNSTIASYIRPLLPDIIDNKIWAKSSL